MRSSTPFSSNEERLNLCEWVIVLALILGTSWALPLIASALEDFKPGKDYRIPYILSDDYWMFRQCAREASRKFPAVIVGDSFVWGQYVGIHQTISHEINRLAGRELIFNLGVNGLHPAAMRGMLHYYGEDIRERAVIMHLNLLWMSSMERDLQAQKESQFNHPHLIPQFMPRLACYQADFGERVSVLLERNWSFFSWASHVKQLYFENMDIPNWTILNPYSNPLTAATFKLPPADQNPRSRPVPWTQQKVRPESFEWVPLEESFQWASFQEAIQEVQNRGNKVFVLIGPFNPYLQTEDSLLRFGAVKRSAEKWLTQNTVEHCAPRFLPSELYADASHPLKEGYTIIAEELFRAESFSHWLQEISDR